VIYNGLSTMTFRLEQGEVKCFDQGHNGQTTWIKFWGGWTFSL